MTGSWLIGKSHSHLEVTRNLTGTKDRGALGTLSRPILDPENVGHPLEFAAVPPRLSFGLRERWEIRIP